MKLILKLLAIFFIAASLFAITTVVTLYNSLQTLGYGDDLELGWPYVYYSNVYYKEHCEFHSGGSMNNLFYDFLLCIPVAVILFIGYNYLMKKTGK
jgi:hypothetical protein